MAGRTRVFARAGGGWAEHGRPKEVFVRPLAADARSALDEPASWGCGRAVPDPPLPGRGQRAHVPGRRGHGSGVVAGRTASDSSGGEIPGTRRLIREIDVAGRGLNLDALRSRPKTARLIIDRGPSASRPSSATAGACSTIWPRSTPTSTPRRQRAFDKAHGRIEERTCAPAPLDGRPNDLAPLPGRPQAFRIVRRRTVVRTGKIATEAVRGLTPLGPDRAGIPALNRGRWEIGNRLHCVRDFSCDGDRSRMRGGAPPRNPACLANAAISIVRLRRRFRHLPQAHRQGDALRKAVRAV